MEEQSGIGGGGWDYLEDFGLELSGKGGCWARGGGGGEDGRGVKSNNPNLKGVDIQVTSE